MIIGLFILETVRWNRVIQSATSFHEEHGVIKTTNGQVFHHLNSFLWPSTFSFSSPSFPPSGILKINVVLHDAQNITVVIT